MSRSKSKIVQVQVLMLVPMLVRYYVCHVSKRFGFGFHVLSMYPLSLFVSLSPIAAVASAVSLTSELNNNLAEIVQVYTSHLSNMKGVGSS